MNMDIAILTETKLPMYHTTNCEGYNITVSEAVSNSKGGVALCVQRSRYFIVKGTKTHGNNVISTQLVSGNKRWFIIGVYIPPSETDHSTIQAVERAAREVEHDNIPVVLIGDLNIDINLDTAWQRYNDCKVSIWSTLQLLQLSDLSSHFTQYVRRDNWTWSQYRNSRLITRKVDYVMVSDSTDFRYHRIKIPCFDTDHRMIVVGLEVDNETNHGKYVRQRKKLDNTIPNNNEGDKYMNELQQELPKNPTTIDHRYNLRIAEDTWNLIDAKAAARKCGNRDEVKRLQTLKRRFLRQDWKIRAEKTVQAEITEACRRLAATTITLWW